MAVSKRLRYEVFRRDSNTCRYCGAKAPDVEITIDHVVPVALGGSDEPSNLVTACRDCNGGKTSTSPDAPLVGDVGEDALRWSAAMRKAADQMLADHDARQHAYDQFEEWWGNWNYGFKKLPLPRPADWRNSIDSFTAAGLPLDVLKWCVDKAGASKAAPDQTWRYMCGIAWKKVGELQEVARSITGGSPQIAEASTKDDDESLKRGRADLAREFLSELDAETIDRLQREAREDWQAGTRDEIDIASAHVAWSDTLIDFSWLTSRTCDLLLATSDSVIQEAVRRARVELFDEKGAGFSRAAFAEKAVHVAAMEFEERRATGYLASLPAHERMEWLAYASAYLGHDSFLITAAARYARSIKAGHAPLSTMCLGRGERIPCCPERATHWIRFSDLECCQQEPEETHEGHRFCGKHLERALAGEQRHSGEPVTVASYRAINETEMAPF